MTHMMEAAADIDLMKRMGSACRLWRLLLILFRCPCIKSLNCAVVMLSPHYQFIKIFGHTSSLPGLLAGTSSSRSTK
jgi:hypothetical protein